MTEYIDSGKNYDNVKKIYSINIVYFDLGQGQDYIYHGKTEFRGLHENDVLKLSGFQQQKFGVTEVYELYPEYYILKVNDFNRWSKVPLDQWIYFLSTSEIPEDADAPGLKAAREKLLFSRMSREEQAAYRRYLDNRVSLADQIYTARGEARLEGLYEGRKEGIKQGIEQGRKEGIKQGIEQGIEQGIKQGIERGIEQGILATARNLKQMGLSIADIAKATGLSAEQLEGL